MAGWQLRKAGVVGLPALLVQLGAISGASLIAWQLARRFLLVGVLLGMPPKTRGGKLKPSLPPPKRDCVT